ncbi:MAG: 1-deoxy-D-xylulose-5-phosphate reductoisomerase [Candidatus Aadella gelida]|nr:1-deoxy-D-xylulose-5-phosphate reductoisomerase [Candidatus Aadella gelida]
MKSISLLGSTGSIGRNVLDVVRKNPDKFKIKAIAAREDIDSLVSQVEEFSPTTVAVTDGKCYEDLKKKISGKTKVISGDGCLEEITSDSDVDIVFISISGTAALRPLVAAVQAGKVIALASKEPIVSAGKLIMDMARENSAVILPVDSEHSAIMQCLGEKISSDISKIYITGSGGSLRETDQAEFDHLSVEDVLNHPKWDMGKKITVDSATLMNKGLEVIEARWLFDVEAEKIKIIIHPEAVIHSMIEFMDGTISASLCYPDMRYPILKALSYPGMIDNDFPRVDFLEINKFSFEEANRKKFPAIDLAYNALNDGGVAPAVLNAANETAVGLFLDNKIKFNRIMGLVESVLKAHKRVDEPSLSDIQVIEKWASEEVLRSC